jgi:chromosome segregation ATPase
MNARERADLFRFLVSVDTRLNEVEALHNEKNKSLEARVDSLTLINDWAEAQARTSKREAGELRQENLQLRRKLHKAENDRDVMKKELQIMQDHNRFVEQDRDALDVRIRSTDNERKRMRKSYNELNRKLGDDIRNSDAMMDLRKFLMN